MTRRGRRRASACVLRARKPSPRSAVVVRQISRSPAPLPLRPQITSSAAAANSVHMIRADDDFCSAQTSRSLPCSRAAAPHAVLLESATASSEAAAILPYGAACSADGVAFPHNSYASRGDATGGAGSANFMHRRRTSAHKRPLIAATFQPTLRSPLSAAAPTANFCSITRRIIAATSPLATADLFSPFSKRN